MSETFEEWRLQLPSFETITFTGPSAEFHIRAERDYQFRQGQVCVVQKRVVTYGEWENAT